VLEGLNPLRGMVKNRDEHRKPVIRAFVALPGETLVGVTARSLPGSGLCVLLLNRDEQYEKESNTFGYSSHSSTKHCLGGILVESILLV